MLKVKLQSITTLKKNNIITKLEKEELIDNGFNEEDVVIGESNANGTEMYFNLSNYKNIKNFANCKCKLNTLVK